MEFRNSTEQEDISLSILYEDMDLVVMTAPNEDELRDILLRLLKDGPQTIRQLHSYLSGLASEDKIRRALNTLIEERKVDYDKQGRYFLAEYIDEEDFESSMYLGEVGGASDLYD